MSPQAATSRKQTVAKVALVCPLACVDLVVGLQHTQRWKLSVWEFLTSDSQRKCTEENQSVMVELLNKTILWNKVAAGFHG